MITVGIRELKNRLSHYIRQVKRGEDVLVADRGDVVAELRQPGVPGAGADTSALVRHARAGKARLGAPNDPQLYPKVPKSAQEGTARRLLDAERGER